MPFSGSRDQRLPKESISLELGKPIERQLTGGLSHFYKITMASGQFLRIVVKQQGIDVAVEYENRHQARMEIVSLPESEKAVNHPK